MQTLATRFLQKTNTATKSRLVVFNESLSMLISAEVTAFNVRTKNIEVPLRAQRRSVRNFFYLKSFRLELNKTRLLQRSRRRRAETERNDATTHDISLEYIEP